MLGQLVSIVGVAYFVYTMRKKIQPSQLEDNDFAQIQHQVSMDNEIEIGCHFGHVC